MPNHVLASSSRERIHKSSLIGAGLTNVRHAPVSTKFRSAPKWRDVPSYGHDAAVEATKLDRFYIAAARSDA
jgi:hypothetical protein